MWVRNNVWSISDNAALKRLVTNLEFLEMIDCE